MLDFNRRAIPLELQPLHILARAGLSRTGPRPTAAVDISKLLESRDSESPAENKSTSSTPIAGATSNSTPKSFTSVPSFAPPSGFPLGPPPTEYVRSPPQLPPVSSLQSGPVLQPSPYISNQPYVAPLQQYYSSPPASAPLPSFSPHNLPPISASIPSPIPVSLAAAFPLPPTIPAKRAAESSSQSSAPPLKKHHGKWTEDEDNLAIELRRRGMKWDDIAKRIPGRSAISCRLRYQNYSEKRPNWDEEKKNKLARLYNRFKREMWEMVATEMGLPWRAVEAMHWQMGQEEMASRANVPVFQPHGSGALKSPDLEAPPQLAMPRTRRSSSTSSRQQRAASLAIQSDRSVFQLAPVSESGTSPATVLPPIQTSMGESRLSSQTMGRSAGSPDEYSPDPYMTPSPPIFAQLADGRSAAAEMMQHQRSASQPAARVREAMLPPMISGPGSAPAAIPGSRSR